MSCADADDQFTKLIAEPQSHLNRFHQDEALVKQGQRAFWVI
jgi:hypothetical protein